MPALRQYPMRRCKACKADKLHPYILFSANHFQFGCFSELRNIETLCYYIAIFDGVHSYYK